MVAHNAVSNSISRTHGTGASELNFLNLESNISGDYIDPESTTAMAEASAVSSGSRSPGDLVELRFVPSNAMSQSLH